MAMMEEIRLLREQLAAVRMSAEDGVGDIALLRSGSVDAAQVLQLKALQEDRDRQVRRRSVEFPTARIPSERFAAAAAATSRWRMRATVAEAECTALTAAALHRSFMDAEPSTPPPPLPLLRRSPDEGGPELDLNPLFSVAEEELGEEPESLKEAATDSLVVSSFPSSALGPSLLPLRIGNGTLQGLADPPLRASSLLRFSIPVFAASGAKGSAVLSASGEDSF